MRCAERTQVSESDPHPPPPSESAAHQLPAAGQGTSSVPSSVKWDNNYLLGWVLRSLNDRKAMDKERGVSEAR